MSQQVEDALLWNWVDLVIEGEPERGNPLMSDLAACQRF
jgi:hypothetical protein